MTAAEKPCASCPHCQEPLTEAQVRKIWAQRSSSRRKHKRGGVPVSIRTCRWCGREDSARKIREHMTVCPHKVPTKKKGWLDYPETAKATTIKQKKG